MLAAVALATAVGACGRAGRAPEKPALAASGVGGDLSQAAAVAGRKPETQVLDSDGDYDGEGKRLYDADDAKTFDYGRAANVEDRREVTALVERYYAAAAADDGAFACSLIYGVVAETLGEEYVGGTEQEAPCASAASTLFRRMHRRFAADAASMRVTGVRVEGERGRALVSFGTAPTRYVLVHRQGPAWRIYYPFDSGLS